MLNTSSKTQTAQPRCLGGQCWCFTAGKEGQRSLLKAIFSPLPMEEDPFLAACSPPRGTTRYALCNLQDGHHLSVLLERDLLVAPGQKGWVSRELAEM